MINWYIVKSNQKLLEVNEMIHLKLSFLLLLLSLTYSEISFAQPDRAAYLWRQGMVLTAQRGIGFCRGSQKTVKRYLKFSTLAEKRSADLFREYGKYKEIKLPKFQVAAQHYKKASQFYRKSIQMFEQGAQHYTRSKATASRATDDTLPRLRSIIKRQLYDSNKIYRNAKELIVLGNRAFNAGNRYFNQAVDEGLLKEEEDEGLLKKRFKFHRWPAS